MHRVPRLIVLLLLLLTLVASSAAPAAAQFPVAPPASPSGAGPLFVENVGQFADGARFRVLGGDRSLWLAEDGLWVTIAPPAPDADARPAQAGRDGFPAALDASPAGAVHLKLSYAGANPHPRIEPFNRLDTRVSFFIGADPARWRADAPVWGGVRYVDLYPGLDLELSSSGDGVTQRLVARDPALANASLPQVRLQVEGADGLALDAGRLRVQTALGDYALALPVLLGTTAPAPARVVGAQVTAPWTAAPFTAAADPGLMGAGPSDLLYATFLGGDQYDRGYGLEVDAAGCAYVTGSTASPDFPATFGPGYDASYNGGPSDAFVVKLNAAGTGLVYATFLGGSDNDAGYDIAVDAAGCAYVAGGTQSSDFPAALGPGYDTSYNGGTHDASVVKLNAAGTEIVYATFLGGSNYDEGYSIAIDAAGCAYVTGYTESPDFPAALGPGYDTSYNSDGDVYVVKLNAAGTGMVYATFLGGSNDDAGYGIAVDAAGCAYVMGYTISSDFPAALGPGYDVSFNWGRDAFVAKLNAAGTGLVYATFLGGTRVESGYGGIAVDAAGCAYVAGRTESPDFPAALGPGYDTTHNGGEDAFVVKLNAAGTEVVYATFLGGGAADYGGGIAVDAAGCAYVSGGAGSSDFPAALGPGYDATHNGGDKDAYVVKLNAACTEVVYATFLGGGGADYGGGIAVDAAGCAYVSGGSTSSDFPATLGPGYDASYNGSYDAYVVKLNAAGTGIAHATFLGGSGVDWAANIAVDAAGCAYVAGYTASPDFPAALGPGYDTAHNGGEDAFAVKLNAAGTGLVYATFLGGNDWDYGNSIAVDAAGCAYVAGYTASPDFPAALGPGFDASYNGGWDAFVVNLRTPAPSPWDLNGDCLTDIGDVVRVGLVWDQTGAPGWVPEDLNLDGAINIGDVVVIGLHWNETVC